MTGVQTCALPIFVVEGVKTTGPLHRRIMDHPDFISGAFSTKWMEKFMDELKAEQDAAKG